MNVNISSRVEDDYLLIKSSGNIVDFKEHKSLMERFYSEVVKYGINKVIFNVTETQFPISLQVLNDIVDFYTVELPYELYAWKVAVVDDSSYRELGKFWEFRANQNGYNSKVFSSIEEAQKYMSDI